MTLSIEQIDKEMKKEILDAITYINMDNEVMRLGLLCSRLRRINRIKKSLTNFQLKLLANLENLIKQYQEDKQ